MEEKLSYYDALNMTYDELYEINTAMDLYAEKLKQASKKLSQ
jgi:hypothetical protein|nr:MAG TPA: hypothetical protein [Caudoviricetes sp.]